MNIEALLNYLKHEIKFIESKDEVSKYDIGYADAMRSVQNEIKELIIASRMTPKRLRELQSRRI